MTSEQHASSVATFRAFLTRPPESTREWAHTQGFQNPSDAESQTMLLWDRQVWILREPCSRPDLVVTPYADSKN